jgi:hypothetical protein
MGAVLGTSYGGMWRCRCEMRLKEKAVRRRRWQEDFGRGRTVEIEHDDSPLCRATNCSSKGLGLGFLACGGGEKQRASICRRLCSKRACESASLRECAQTGVINRPWTRRCSKRRQIQGVVLQGDLPCAEDPSGYLYDVMSCFTTASQRFDTVCKRLGFFRHRKTSMKAHVRSCTRRRR